MGHKEWTAFQSDISPLVRGSCDKSYIADFSPLTALRTGDDDGRPRMRSGSGRHNHAHHSLSHPSGDAQVRQYHLKVYLALTPVFRRGKHPPGNQVDTFLAYSVNTGAITAIFSILSVVLVSTLPLIYHCDARLRTSFGSS